MSKQVAIYPGTFDPITNGHLDVIKRAVKIFDKVYVAVAESESKKPMFDLKTRVKMAKEVSKNFDNVEVISFTGLLVDCCKKQNAKVIVRGLRAVSDFEYELQIGYANASLDSSIDTVYLMPTLNSAFISSTVVRDILKHGGNVMHLVPKEIKQYVHNI
ncbi:pantetheine-phosphate adenylyltransferase [Sulfurospirillum sp. 1307]|jgi:pantetheine-phosphate adenylyltransferase